MCGKIELPKQPTNGPSLGDPRQPLLLDLDVYARLAEAYEARSRAFERLIDVQRTLRRRKRDFALYTKANCEECWGAG